MSTKSILAFDISEKDQIDKFLNKSSYDNLIAGLAISSKDILRDKFSSIRPEIESLFVVVLKLEKDNHQDQTLFWKKLVQALLSFFLEVNYYRYFGKRVLIIDAADEETDYSHYLRPEFKALGIHDIEIVHINNIGTHLTSTQAADIKWTIINKKTFLHEAHLSGEDDKLQSLREDNFQLRSKVSILEKNINDLNNYYRFVRGETTFKYHNRQEEVSQGGDNIPPEELTNLINTTIQHPVNSNNLTHYTEVYERLPWLYKKIGGVLKVITGRRGFFYFLDKKQKNAFINFLQLLPEDKRIEVWYYYEYEILPGWYKKIGNLINKK
jgi:hypothetical protein